MHAIVTAQHSSRIQVGRNAISLVFIDTLDRLLGFFPQFSIYFEGIRNIFQSIIELYARLLRQKAAVEVHFRVRPLRLDRWSHEIHT